MVLTSNYFCKYFTVHTRTNESQIKQQCHSALVNVVFKFIKKPILKIFKIEFFPHTIASDEFFIVTYLKTSC